VTTATTSGRLEVGALAGALSGELDSVARLLSDRIHEHLSELDDDLYALTLESVRSNLGMLMTMLREGADPATAVPPLEAMAYAREYVRRGLSADLLRHAYRIAQGALSHLWMDRLRAATDDPDRLVEGAAYFNDWLFAWIEVVERQVGEVYERERESWRRSAAAIRADELRAILDGGRVEVPEASRRLGYELDRLHVAFVVWSDEASPDAEPAPMGMKLASAVGEALDAPSLLAVPQGTQLACWAAPRRTMYPPCEAPPHLHVALGGPHRGVRGFVRSHREALAAKRIAALTGSAWTPFGDIALDSLATQDLDEARRFVSAELGPLAGGDDPARRLRSTLTVFLEEGSSFVGAARRLGVHENTVTYRVHRAEEILGHRVVERQLELRVALRVARLVL
jgi:DNA-binding PucR family transcriptional regulator